MIFSQDANSLLTSAASKRPAVAARWAWRALLTLSLLGVQGCTTPEIGDAPVAVQLNTLPPGVADAYRRLTSSTIGLAERSAAASTLIQIDDFEADRALAAALNRDQSPSVWQAVFLSVASEPGEPPRGLWRPMVSLLYVVDDALVTDVCLALGRYDQKQLVQRLTDAATSTTLPSRERGRAIAALGQQRTADVTETLVKLTGVTQPADVQSAAYAALATLTGIDRFGEDRRAWAEWWDQARHMDQNAWQRQLVMNFARKFASGRATDQQLEDKLREAVRALYQASSPEDQAGVLAYMLNDSVVATRSLALDLAQRRLVQGVVFDEPLREAVRKRLDDDSPEIRRLAALVLRDLADETAADIVSQKLVNHEENVNSVLEAYLQLLARLPRKNATDAVYDLLNEPGLRGDAAGALASIARAGQLTPRRSSDTAHRLRQQLASGQRPSAQMVNLLGKVGDNDDWNQYIEPWIDDSDDVIKQAAAQAWADSERSLAILAERAADPIIQPIVINAATRRGQYPETLKKLAANPPSQPQFVEAWSRALVAMAGRVLPAQTLEALAILAEHRDDPELRERMLSAAIDRPVDPSDGEPAGVYLQLLLERAQTRLESGHADLAVVDYERLLSRVGELPNPERERLYRGLIPAYLQAARYDEAFTAARAFFEDPADPTSVDPATVSDPLMQMFLDTALKEVQLGRPDSARQVFDSFQLLLGVDPQLPPSLTPKLNALREQLYPDTADNSKPKRTNTP